MLNFNDAKWIINLSFKSSPFKIFLSLVFKSIGPNRNLQWAHAINMMNLLRSKWEIYSKDAA
jgi:hypothetical protein